MSTNYYMMTTNKKFVEKYFPLEYDIVDHPYFGYQIHIGKRSGGWNPLFQEHAKAYSSVSEMLDFIRNNTDKIRIFDEYGIEFNLEGLKFELVEWGERQEKRIIHYNDEVGDVQVPIDHCEMALRDKRMSSYSGIQYWKDVDDYEFTNGEFS